MSNDFPNKLRTSETVQDYPGLSAGVSKTFVSRPICRMTQQRFVLFIKTKTNLHNSIQESVINL